MFIIVYLVIVCVAGSVYDGEVAEIMVIQPNEEVYIPSYCINIISYFICILIHHSTHI